MGWACGAYGWEERVYRVLVGKPEGRRPLGRPRRFWVDNIRMDLQEVGCGYMDWIGLAQDRDRWRTLETAVMNLRVPWNAGNFLTSCKSVSFSIRTLHNGGSEWVSNALLFLSIHLQWISSVMSLLHSLTSFKTPFPSTTWPCQPPEYYTGCW